MKKGETPTNEEIVVARGGYDTLGERLDKETKEIYDILGFLSYKGKNITVEHSKIGATRNMQIEGVSYQNLINVKEISSGNSVLNGVITLVGREGYGNKVEFDTTMLKPNTTYTFIVSNTVNTLAVSQNRAVVQLRTEGFSVTAPIEYTPGEIATKVTVCTTLNNIVNGRLFIEIPNIPKGEWKGTILLLEGDYTNKYIPPHFEGIKSAGEGENKIILLSHGKNLVDNSKNSLVDINYSTGVETQSNKYISTDFIDIHDKGQSFIAITEVNTGLTIGHRWYDKDKRYIQDTTGTEVKPVDKSYYVRLIIPAERTYETPQDVMFQLREKTKSSEYEPYKSDRKEINLPFSNGLKELPNGTKDLIYKKGTSSYVRQNIGKKVFNGVDEGRWVEADKVGTTRRFYLSSNLDKKVGQNSIICDKLPTIPSISDESIGLAGYNTRIYIKLPDTTVTGTINDYLKNNNMIVYYELVEPVETKIEVSDINLKTFNEITYILSENTIQPNLSFEAPCDVQEVISTLNTRNITLQKEVDEKTTQLQEKDKQLEEVQSNQVAKDLDLDFRLFELEMNSQSPMKVNKGRNSTVSTPYELMKYCIEHNLYDKLDMEYKINRYLAGNRITKEQSIELLELIK